MKGGWINPAVGLAAGVLCHGSFVVAIAVMAYTLYTGMQSGLGRLQGPAAAVADIGLLLQFPLLHSFFLSRRGRAWLARLAPRGLGRPLAPTSYAIFASTQILLVFGLWSPSGEILVELDGAWLTLSQVMFAASWVFVAWTIHDAGMGLQTGFTGWWAVVRGRQPSHGPFPTEGFFGLCRQPVYLAFMMPLWTAPVWTPDRLAVVLVLSAYCVVGPRFKERRYTGFYGEAFRNYQARVPYLIPGTKP